MYVYIFMYVCIYVCMHTCMHLCVCIYVCKYACMYLCMFACVQVWTYVSMAACIYGHVIFIHLCMHAVCARTWMRALMLAFVQVVCVCFVRVACVVRKCEFAL